VHAKGGRRSPMDAVEHINGSEYTRFEINDLYLKGHYSSKIISFM
jgi:hypothetical protein